MLFRALAGRWQEKQERGWLAASSKIQVCCCACNGVGTRAEVAVARHRREPATIKQKSRPAAAEIKLERGCNQLVSANKIYQKGIRQQPFKSIAVGQQFLCWRLEAGVFTATEVSPTTQRQNDTNPMPLKASSKLQFTCQPGKFY